MKKLSTERITDVHRDTVMRFLVRFGNDCHEWLNLTLSNLVLEHIEADEIWTFVRKKDKRLTGREKQTGDVGSQFLYVGIDQQTKLIAAYRIGKRSEQTTRAFVNDLAARMYRGPETEGDHRPQISTDGFQSYPHNIGKAFGGTVRHGVLIKQYVNPEVGRYAPPDLRRADRLNVDGIDDLATICTSHVERHNLSIRTFLKRFTRLSIGFSKKLENLKAAVAIHVAYHNFCWRLRKPGKSGERTPTPAMMPGLTHELWTLERLYDEVNDKAWRDERSRRTARLIVAMEKR